MIYHETEHGILYQGDCLDIMKTLPDNSVDAVVTDPPYGLSFMGKKWDYAVPSVEIWAECLRVLKPGGYLLSFAGTRTQHRIACGIEDAGFEIRDMIAWIYGSGFPKSLDVGKAIDKRGGQTVSWFGKWLREWREENAIAQREISKLFPSKTGGLTGCVANWELGFNMPTNEQFNLICETFNLPFDSLEEAEREIVGKAHGTSLAVAPGQNTDRPAVIMNLTAPATPEAKEWDGYGTALKPALEPITVARKPIDGTVAENVLKWGTGAIDIDGCRVEIGNDVKHGGFGNGKIGFGGGDAKGVEWKADTQGRFPANLIHDGSDEVLACFPETKSAGNIKPSTITSGKSMFGIGDNGYRNPKIEGDNGGSAARFFYCAKASRAERNAGLEDMQPVRESDRVRDDGVGGDNPRNRTNKAKQNHHPTVKPIALMEYLVKLVSRPGATVLDPFLGSGTTALACVKQGRRYIGCEMDKDYCEIAAKRIDSVCEQTEIAIND